MKETQAKFIICYDGSRKNVVDALNQTDLLGKTKVIVLEKACPTLEEDWPAKEDGFVFYNDFILDAEKLIQPPVLQEGPPKDEDTAIIFWSSGTTGQPKARALLQFGPKGGGRLESKFLTSVLFMSYSTLDKVSKLVPNLEYLFSFNFQLKNAETKFCFLGHLNAIKVP